MFNGQKEKKPTLIPALNLGEVSSVNEPFTRSRNGRDDGTSDLGAVASSSSALPIVDVPVAGNDDTTDDDVENFEDDAPQASSSSALSSPPIASSSQSAPQQLTATQFILACWKVIEQANLDLDDKSSQFASLFENNGIETRRAFLRTHFSHSANYNKYRQVTQRNIFFSEEFDNISGYAQQFSSALFARENGKYALIRAASLVSLIRLLLKIINENHGESPEKDNEMLPASLLSQVKAFVKTMCSETVENPFYENNTIKDYFKRYIPERDKKIFLILTDNIKAATKQIKLSSEQLRSRLERETRNKWFIKDQLISAADSKLSDEQIVIAVVSRKRAIDQGDKPPAEHEGTTVPSSAAVSKVNPLKHSMYDSYWQGLNDWIAGVPGGVTNIKAVISKVIVTKQLIYLTLHHIDELRSVQSGEELGHESLHEQMLLPVESAKSQPMYAGQALEPIDYERYLGGISIDINDLQGNPLAEQRYPANKAQEPDTKQANTPEKKGSFLHRMFKPNKSKSKSSPADDSTPPVEPEPAGKGKKRVTFKI